MVTVKNTDRLYLAQDGIKLSIQTLIILVLTGQLMVLEFMRPLIAKYFEKQASEFVILRGEHGKYKDFLNLKVFQSV